MLLNMRLAAFGCVVLALTTAFVGLSTSAAAMRDSDGPCAGVLELQARLSIIPPAGVKTVEDDIVAWEFTPTGHDSFSGEWEGLYSFAGLCQILEELLPCFLDKLAQGEDAASCVP